jgi:lipoyl(octanoyl) transferase
MKELVPIWLGRMNYSDAMVAQDSAIAATSRDHRVRLLGLEHPLVITLGRRANASQDILNNQSTDKAVAPVFRSDRGGQATLHDRGQLVIYPVADLRYLGIGVREWVQTIHHVASLTLKDFSVEMVANDQCTGLFTRNGKIGFIGIALIRSCGVEGRNHDRLSAWTNNPVLLDVYISFMRHFLGALHLTNRSGHDVSEGPFIGI